MNTKLDPSPIAEGAVGEGLGVATECGGSPDRNVGPENCSAICKIIEGSGEHPAKTAEPLGDRGGGHVPTRGECRWMKRIGLECRTPLPPVRGAANAPAALRHG